MATIKKFGFDDIKAASGGLTADQDVIINRRLHYIAEEMCNHARTITPNHKSGGYNDHTGNLRSSIGFAIFHNGKMVEDGGYKFVEPTPPPKTTKTGKPSKAKPPQIDPGKGIEAAKDAIERFGQDASIPLVGWALVMVAGMSYATYVEAKGYNVLSLTEVELNAKIDQLKKELNLK